MIFRRPALRAVVLAAVGLCGHMAPAAAGVACGPLLSVDASPYELGETVCEMADEALKALGECGLVQSLPVGIRVVETAEHLPGGCLSAFDCDRGTVLVTDPAALDTVLGPGDAYRALPPEIVLSNLVAHELAHALIEQASSGGRIGGLEHEYIAGALELEAMDPGWRAVLLGAAGVTPPAREGLISLGVYRLEPRAFAANAWLHFSEPGRGCPFVHGLLKGERVVTIR